MLKHEVPTPGFDEYNFKLELMNGYIEHGGNYSQESGTEACDSISVHILRRLDRCPAIRS